MESPSPSPKTFVDVVCPLEADVCVHNELVTLQEMLSSRDLYELYQKLPPGDPVSSSKAVFQDVFGHELNESIYDMVKYWQQFGFFDIRKDITNIVADISKKAMLCVTETSVPMEEEEEEHYECEDEPA